MSLLQRFDQELRSLALPGRGALVAVSGGPDSVVLLDLLVRTSDTHSLELTVVHLDHGIHPDGPRVARQVRALANSYQLPCETGRLELGSAVGETEARERRYRWLEAVRLRLGADMIMMAHHGDDQAETALMRVLGGSGLAGLSGMAPVSGVLVRPLLRFRRFELEGYLKERGLSAWVDPANADPRHLRSWLRAAVLPQLRARVPAVDANLLRLAGHAANDRHAWDLVLEALPGLDLHQENGAISVAAPVLAGYDSTLAQALIFAVARRVGCRLGPVRVGRVLELLARGSSGDQVPIGSGFQAELSFGRLRLTAPEPDAGPPWVLEGERGQRTWGRWHFRWQPAAAPGEQERIGLRAWVTPGPVTVRGWQPGERLKPLGGTGRRLLVRCFQEVRVPRSRRGSWPVLAQNGDIIWIPGVCRSDARIPAGGTEALRIDAEYA